MIPVEVLYPVVLVVAIVFFAIGRFAGERAGYHQCQLDNAERAWQAVKRTRPARLPVRDPHRLPERRL